MCVAINGGEIVGIAFILIESMACVSWFGWFVICTFNDGMVSPLKRHRNVPNLELNNQVNKVRRPR